MTASTVVSTNQNGKQGKNKPSKGQSSPSKPLKKASEELITPDVLLLMTAASVVSTKKGKNGKNKASKQNNNPNVDVIPTKENNGTTTPDILALLGRKDNAAKLQSTPTKVPTTPSTKEQRPASPPTKDHNNNGNRSRKNSPVSPSSSTQRYAGSSYANSPSPSSLPKPMFGNLIADSSTVEENLSSAVRRIDFSEENVYNVPATLPNFHPHNHFTHSLPPSPHVNHQFVPYQPHLVPHPPHFYQLPFNSVPTPSVHYNSLPQSMDNSHYSNHLRSLLNIGAN
eukprot:TRINITY_DN2763_c0_g1_i1.p1 TRINITY_DN2763_c0_g1~~TRINITY_DN2763_c0_g1_i1.p1  ORF type:complete len:283 (+),score=92.82 TRINITY_DN2763_c0_g1_i1:1097-1945(+)